MLDTKLNEITAHFLNDLDLDKRQKSISLLSGRAGIVLYLAELYKSNPLVDYLKQVEKNLDFIFDELDRTDNLVSTFCDGIGGLGWLLIYLKEEGILKDDKYTGILPDIDYLLNEQIDELVENKNFDLLHGLLGTGLYFIKRNNAATCERILTCISSRCIEDGEEIRFVRTDLGRFSEDIFDLGLPHGMIGTLYFIYKCLQKEILPELCKKLLRGGIVFYFNNIQDISQRGSFFYNILTVSAYKKEPRQEGFSRMAWCYGDLTILYALHTFSKALAWQEIEQRTIDMLLITAKRTHSLLTSVSDATFCHGSTGLAHMFLKLFQLTQKEVFYETAKYWIDETLKYGNEKGYAGYLFEVSNLKESIKAPSSGLLEGIAGVGLVLLAFQKESLENNWDECLFLT